LRIAAEDALRVKEYEIGETENQRKGSHDGSPRDENGDNRVKRVVGDELSNQNKQSNPDSNGDRNQLAAKQDPDVNSRLH
jgi:hypothetical protein